MRSYKGNKNLKAAGVKMNFTKEQIAERIKCKNDPLYFIEKYMKVIHVDRGLVPFEMYDFQKEYVDLIHKNRFVIAKLPRQCGKSTSTVGYILWEVLFGPMQNIGILANKAATAREILGKLRLAYEYIPLWMQQGIVSWNKASIELENGSRVMAASTASSSARGYTYNLILLDEFAFVPHTVADEFFTSVYPTVSSGKTTKVIMVSTPNGMNLFYKYWCEAIEKDDNGKSRNGYVPFEVHWSQVPGRDEEWKEMTLKNIGQDRFNQEFECEFLGSTSTLISPAKLKEIPWIKPPVIDRNDLKAYEEPQKGHSYVVVVDNSRGQGQDYSAFSIIDVTEMPYKQVVVYKSNKIDPILYPTLIMNCAIKYNEAYVLCENNDIGSQTVTILYDELEYPNVFSTVPRGRGGQQLTAGFKAGSKLGVAMSISVKQKGCVNLKSLIESDQLAIKDYWTIEELSSFIARGKSYAAEDGRHDDVVDGLVLFGWLTQQPHFKELCNQDFRLKLQERRIQTQEEVIIPFGYNDGNSSNKEYIYEDNSTWEVVEDEEYDYLQEYNDIQYPISNTKMTRKKDIL
jgi:hypothetical protein